MADQSGANDDLKAKMREALDRKNTVAEGEGASTRTAR